MTVEEDATTSGVPFFQPADTSSDSEEASAQPLIPDHIEIIEEALPPLIAPPKSKKEMRKSGKRPKGGVRLLFSVTVLIYAVQVSISGASDKIVISEPKISQFDGSRAANFDLSFRRTKSFRLETFY